MALVWAMVGAALVVGSLHVRASTITVNSTADVRDPDDGQCTLREATAAATTNSYSGTRVGECTLGSRLPSVDTIAFHIPGAGIKTITLATPLPSLSAGTIIDGYTQPGAVPNTAAIGTNAVLLIQLSGPGTNGRLLASHGAYNVVRGLILNNAELPLSVSGNYSVVEGNWIGLDASGSDRGNCASTGLGVWGLGSRVGGTDLAARNVIGGCATNVRVGADDVVVAGNYIGTNAAGTQALPHDVAANNGILVENANRPMIGGDSVAARNVIAAGADYGLSINQSSDIKVFNNFIGLAANGESSLDGGRVGIYLEQSFDTTYIGDPLAPTTTGNVISGNDIGIQFGGSQVIGATEFSGNRIGTNAAGTQAVPNRVGIDVAAKVGFLGLGRESDAATGNVISGNIEAGVRIAGNGLEPFSSVFLYHNRIGLSANGATLGNGGTGLEIIGTAQGQIESPRIGFNSIGHNGGFGIVLGHAIGAEIGGNTVASNACGGLLIGGGTSFTQIGVSGADNVIRDNLSAAGCAAFRGFVGHGIVVSSQAGVDGPDPAGNEISGNAIWGNAGAGILLSNVPSPISTPNDAGDGDGGPNDSMNYPEITAVITSASSTLIRGTLDSRPNRTYRLQFYVNDTCDSHGAGEGQEYLGSYDTHSLAFDASFGPIPAGKLVTATATDMADENTSEFSRCAQQIASRGRFEFPTSVIRGSENDTSVAVPVLRVGSATGTATVDFATQDDTARDGTHYVTTSGTLTFPDGVTTKDIVITLLNNGSRDGTVSFNVRLSNESLGTTVGMFSKSVLIDDNDRKSGGGGGAVGLATLAWLMLLAAARVRKRSNLRIYSCTRDELAGSVPAVRDGKAISGPRRTGCG